MTNASDARDAAGAAINDARWVSRKIVVRELEEGGWEATDLMYGWTRRYKSAANVAKAIDRADKKMAANGINCITTTEWNWVSRVGEAVVKVLTGNA